MEMVWNKIPNGFFLMRLAAQNLANALAAQIRFQNVFSIPLKMRQRQWKCQTYSYSIQSTVKNIPIYTSLLPHGQVMLYIKYIQQEWM